MVVRIRIDPKEPLMTYEEFFEKLASLQKPGYWDELRTKLDNRLTDYETRYGMSSEEADEKYERGELPDTHEMTAWVGAYEEWRRCFGSGREVK